MIWLIIIITWRIIIINQINILDYINIDLVNYYNTPGDYYDLFEFANKNKINLMDFNLCQFLNYLIDNNLFKKDPIAKKIIYNYVELFFLKKYLNSNFKRFVLEFYYSFIKKVNNCNQFNLDEESLFMEFKSKILNG